MRRREPDTEGHKTRGTDLHDQVGTAAVPRGKDTGRRARFRRDEPAAPESSATIRLRYDAAKSDPRCSPPGIEVCSAERSAVELRREVLMITILFRMTVKAERDDEWRELAFHLTRSTRSEDEGCVNYVYHRRVDNPREYVLYEQWRDEEALTAHLVRLVQLLGPPPAGGRLPAAFLDNFEQTQAVRYETLG